MKARISEGRNPNWDLDLRYGKQGERMVAAFIEGERMVAAFIEGFTNGTVEVKTDRRSAETGNVYIEDECLTAAGWRPSGIATTEASYWAVVIGEVIVIAIPTEIVRACYQKALDPHLRYHREEKSGSHPTRGVAIPLNHLLTWVRMELLKRAAAA